MFGLEPDNMPTSNLRNGLLRTSGLELTCFDHIPEVQICALTSRGQVATGRISVPADPVVLREVADWFNKVAEALDVSDPCQR
jgi:hypothetical protein